MSEFNEFNEGHISEALDRCHVIMVMIDEFLIEHPGVLKVDSNDDICEAQDLIMEVYQRLGRYPQVEPRG